MSVKASPVAVGAGLRRADSAVLPGEGSQPLGDEGQLAAEPGLQTNAQGGTQQRAGRRARRHELGAEERVGPGQGMG